MESLQKKILQEGIVVSDAVVKLDSFLNHQVDPLLMAEIGAEFARRFADAGVTRVLTVESSGIAPALMTAWQLRVPLVFARKKKPMTIQGEVYRAPVYSFTKQEMNEVMVEKKCLFAHDRVLIMDDILANGEATLGLANIVRQAGAAIVGIGIVIEKSFQPGRAKLEAAGYVVESLVRIASLQDGRIRFAGDPDEAESQPNPTSSRR